MRGPKKQLQAARCRALFRGWLACCSLVVWSAFAPAQDALRVLVLEPAEPNARERELSTRLKGELGAAGFDVRSQPLPADGDLRVAVAVQGSEEDPVAAFAIASSATEIVPGEAPTIGLQLWLSDRVEGAIILQAAEDGRGGPKAVSLLAVQGVELLQARVAAAKLQTGLSPPELDAPPPEPEPEQERGMSIRVGAGVGVFLEAGTGGTAPSPLVRLASSWPVDVGSGSVELGARISGAGFGKATVIRAPALHVDIMQSFVLAEFVAASSAEAALRGFASLGGGAYRVEVEGVGDEEAVGRLQDTWSGVLSAGAGVSLHALAPWYVELEGQGLFAQRPTTVQIASESVATFGRPLFMLSLSIGVSL